MFYFDGYNLAKSEKNAVIVFGGSLEYSLPVKKLAETFDFNFQLLNKSFSDLSVKNAKDIFCSYIKPMHPEGILIHIGEKDLNLFRANSSEFDSLYLHLIEAVKETNPKCRIALISLYNEEGNQIIADMNRHINAIADSEKCDYIDVQNARLWNPAASKAAIRFAQNMGLNVRKPLRDVAEILYSYAYQVLLKNNTITGLAG